MKKSFFTTREIAFLAVMTALNSTIELTFGNFLHAVGFPMKGSVLVGLNVIIYSLTFSRLRHFGAATCVGAGTVFVNFLFTGSFKFFALPLIFAESLTIDIILTLLKNSRAAVILGGMTAGIVAGLGGVFNSVVFRGVSLNSGLTRMTGQEVNLGSSVGIMFAYLVISRAVVGIFFGYLAWLAVKRLEPILDKFVPVSETEQLAGKPAAVPLPAKAASAPGAAASASGGAVTADGTAAANGADAAGGADISDAASKVAKEA